MSATTWDQQHVIGHHSDTNVDGKDPDLYHFTFLTRSGLLGFRVSPGTRREPSHRLWQLGVAVRCLLTTVGPSLLWDLLCHAVTDGKFLGIVPLPQTSRGKWSVPRQILHVAGRLLVLGLVVGQPVVRAGLLAARAAAGSTAAGSIAGLEDKTGLGLSSSLSPLFAKVLALHRGEMWLKAIPILAKGLAFMALPFAIHGVIFYIFSQVSHIQASCFAGPIGREGRGKSSGSKAGSDKPGGSSDGGQYAHPRRRAEWAAMQVSSTLDWAVDSRLWLFLSNGLCHQSVHHLFPQVTAAPRCCLGAVVLPSFHLFVGYLQSLIR